jgi:Flp pilus assembly pilin Flp
MDKLYYGAYRLWKDNRGQDMIEYALMAASIVVVVAGFLPQTLMPSVSTIFSKLVSLYSQS